MTPTEEKQTKIEIDIEKSNSGFATDEEALQRLIDNAKQAKAQSQFAGPPGGILAKEMARLKRYKDYAIKAFPNHKFTF